MADYARHLALPRYTRIVRRAVLERVVEPAYHDMVARTLPALRAARSPVHRLWIRYRFHAEMLWLMIAALPLRLESGQNTVGTSRREVLPRPIDFRAAIRDLSRKPRLTATVALTFALGISASTAVLGAVRAVLFKPLPYPEAERLVHIWATWPGGAGNISHIDYRAILEENSSFDAVTAYEAWGSVTLNEGVNPRPLNPTFTTPVLTRILGFRPLLGRLLNDDDNRSPGGDRNVVLSHALWQTEFGADSAIIGRSVRLNGVPFVVVGVMSEDVADLAMLNGPPSDIWLPVETASAMLAQPALTEPYRIFWGLARLRPGATVEQASEDLAAIARRLEVARPETHRGYTLRSRALSDYVRGEFTAPAKLLFAGACLLLVIGCANAANLLLARAVQRRHELAVRRALGASDQALIRQSLAESLCLVALGGVMGILLAVWGTSALQFWIRSHVSSFVDIRLDVVTIVMAVAATLVTGVALGIVTAAQDGETDLRTVLSSGARGSGRRRTLRRALLAAEVCVCVVLLVGAGLMIRSVTSLTGAGLGYRTDDLVTLRLELSGSRYASDTARILFVNQLLEASRGAPDIASVTVWGPSLLGRATWIMNLLPSERQSSEPTDFRMAFRHSVNPGGLSDLGIPLRAGRDFTDTDNAAAPLVAIISESLAREFWPDGNAVGSSLKRTNPALPPITVIGVAGDAIHRQRYHLGAIAEGFAPQGLGPQRDIYLPYAQRANTSLTLGVRARTTVPAAIEAIRATVHSIDQDLPIADLATLDERLSRQDVAPTSLAALLSAYAALALLLTVVGLYGVLAQSVALQTREIGIRMALGARRSRIAALVLTEGLGLTILGAAVGALLAFVATRFVSSLLYGVAPTDPAAFAVSVGLVFVFAIIVMQAPIRRATRVDPITTLREE